MNDFKHTAEMALFEIWGALQMSGSTHDIQNIARAAMERAGLLEAKQNDGWLYRPAGAHRDGLNESDTM